RRRHTRSKRDWSSDVCSSDLGSKIKVFATEIPHSVRAKETSAEGKSIFAHDPGGKVAEGYKNLTQEVMKLEKQREKSRAGIGRRSEERRVGNECTARG